jgi:hypothetical protein
MAREFGPSLRAELSESCFTIIHFVDPDLIVLRGGPRRGQTLHLSDKLNAFKRAVVGPTRALGAYSENDGARESNLAKERDVITEPINPRVRVTNGRVDVDTGEDVVDW